MQLTAYLIVVLALITHVVSLPKEWNAAIQKDELQSLRSSLKDIVKDIINDVEMLEDHIKVVHHKNNEIVTKGLKDPQSDDTVEKPTKIGRGFDTDRYAKYPDGPSSRDECLGNCSSLHYDYDLTTFDGVEYLIGTKQCHCIEDSLKLDVSDYYRYDSGPNLCELMDVAITGDAQKVIDDVNSWQECQDECQREAICYGWTYVTDNFASKEIRKKCELHGQTYNERKVAVGNAISGPKWCNGCPLINYEYHFQSTNTVESTKVDSWQGCSVRCKNNKDCYAWTYYSENYDIEDARKDCDLKDSTYGQEEHTTHTDVISGLKGCTAEPIPKNWKFVGFGFSCESYISVPVPVTLDVCFATCDQKRKQKLEEVGANIFNGVEYKEKSLQCVCCHITNYAKYYQMVL